MTDVDIETGSKVIDLMLALKESLSPGAPEKAAEVVALKIEPEDNVPCDADAEAATQQIESGEATAQRLNSPVDTVGWRATRVDGIETFTAPNGQAYVRARPDEDADVIVTFKRILGMTDLRLIDRSESATVKRAARKKRREDAELRRRGYDV